MPSAAAVRMEDVAREAGVSPVTVSRALNTPEKLAPATLAAVRAAIERLRYVPNLTAGSLASNRSRIVAAIVPTIANSIFSDTIDGLATVMAPHRYQLLLGQTQYRDDEEAQLVEAFLGRRVDGLVLTGVKHARGLRARLQRAGIPVVETWDLTARPIDMLVGFSNRAAGEAAARYLLGKGYRRLAFIGGEDDSLGGATRRVSRCGAHRRRRRGRGRDRCVARHGGRRRPGAGAIAARGSAAARGVLHERHARRRRAVRVPAPAHRGAGPRSR